METSDGQHNAESDVASVGAFSMELLDRDGVEELHRLASQHQHSRYQNVGEILRPWDTDLRDFAPNTPSPSSLIPTTPTLRARSVATSGSESPRDVPAFSGDALPVFVVSDISGVLQGVHFEESNEGDIIDDIGSTSSSSLSEEPHNELPSPTCGKEQASGFSTSGDTDGGAESDKASTVGMGRSALSNPSTTTSGSEGGHFVFPFLELVVHMKSERNVVFRAIRDTGAKINLIAARILRRLGNPGTEYSPREVITIEGRMIEVSQRVKLIFSINEFGDRSRKAWFHVIEDYRMTSNFDSILGDNFIKKHDLFKDPLPVKKGGAPP